MTQTSPLGYIVRGVENYDAGGAHALNADYPVSTNHAQYVLNNLQHTYDESTQVKVNFCAPTLAKSLEAVGTLTNVYFPIASFIFPMQFNYEGKYPEALVVRVGARVNTEGAAVANIAAVLCPAYQPIGPHDVQIGGHWAKLTGVTSSTAGEWMIGDIMDDYNISTPASFASSYIYSKPFVESDTRSYVTKTHTARLTIYGYCTNSVGTPIDLLGVSAREFRKTLT